MRWRAFAATVAGFREHWRDYAVVGIVNTALPFTLFSWASQHVPASVAAILNATSPFFGAIVAALWLGDRVTPGKLLGMALGFAGVVFLVGWRPGLSSGDALLGVCACLVGALCYGIASVYAKTRLAGLPSFAIALYSQMVAAIVLAPVLPLATLPTAITPVVAANVLGLAVASTALAYLLYFRLIADLGPARALTVTFLIPMFGVLWGWLFLGEAIGIDTLAACALIVSGTWVAVRPPVAGKAEARRWAAQATEAAQTSSAAGPSICSRSSR